MAADLERIRACFPHKEYRPGQLDFIKEAIEAIDGGAENVVVEAPTGTGKTPAIITIAKYYTMEYREARKSAEPVIDMIPREREAVSKAQMIMANSQAHMITSMKLLQDQYLKDDGSVQLMKGKGNYLCDNRSSGIGMSCADREMMFGSTCSGRNSCAYQNAKLDAQLARLTLHNFESFLNQVSMGGTFLSRRILTIDEAHNTDERLINAISFELSRAMFSKYKLDSLWVPVRDVRNQSDTATWLHKRDEVLGEYKKIIDDEILGLKESAGKAMTPVQASRLSELAKIKSSIEDTRRRVGRYLVSYDKVPWSVEYHRDRDSVRFEPVKSSFFAKSALLDYGQSRVFMSATIFDKGRRLMSALNLRPDKTHYIAVPCQFRKERRPLVNSQVADTGRNEYQTSKPKIVSAIKQILKAHKTRGVIHCNSYDMANDIMASVGDDRLMTHTSASREEKVAQFMSRHKDDAVLVGVFLREGYDFKDDIARFQIIVRLPFSWPDQRTKMRDEIEPGYYDWLCAIDLVQMVGRGVRNPDDHCVTYCLDNRLDKFMKRAGYMFPQWFTEAILNKDGTPYLMKKKGFLK